MRVVDKKNPRSQPFDIPSGLAAILIRENYVVEWQEAKPVKHHNFRWMVAEAQNGGIFLSGNCDVCNTKARFSGENPRKAFTISCGQPQSPSDAICEEYLRVLKMPLVQGARA